ncbi:DUF362 domain-containing protein [Methanosarcina siciliae]|nr:DUF362 domain-containing protein [Methanosarcina siciliae]
MAEKSMSSMDTEEVLKKLGLWQVAEAEAVDEILTFDHMKCEHVEPIDYMIVLPAIKTHWTATFTMGVKSRISITSERDRRQFSHGQGMDILFGYMIAESNLVSKPDFYIPDATKCFVTKVSNVGTLRGSGIALGSPDVIANDVVRTCSSENLGHGSQDTGEIGLGSVADQKGYLTGIRCGQQRRNHN